MEGSQLNEFEKLKEINRNLKEKVNQGITGWICPVCGRGLSPFTNVCPCKPFPAPVPTYSNKIEIR